MCEKKIVSFHKLFSALDHQRLEDEKKKRNNTHSGTVMTSIERHMGGFKTIENMNGIKRIHLCRLALEALDKRGWNRSFHQRMFHEEYLKSCTRVFFKRDGPGAFARAHSRVLEVNSWDSTPQEILVSTPRRFGKTISVSMFAAAMIFSCPNMELSIYSTCKRISQKLLRNIVKFLELIFLELNIIPFKFLRINQEEVHVAGNEGQGDVRVINSYPSKIDATTRGILPSKTSLQYIWKEWLWKNDCNAANEELYGDMNSMHIIGILLALLESLNPMEEVLLQTLMPDIPLVHLYKKYIAQYSLRELTNQVECLQLSWGQVLSHGDFEVYYEVLKKLFARFGYIIHHAYSKDDVDLDDPQYITPIPSSDEKEVFIATRKYIRQMICIFLSLFRAIYIISSAEIVPEISEETESVIKMAFKSNHIESSLDLFNHLQQIICLAPGMRLVYRTNFSGMYNDISQVVYFHHPKFIKQAQLKLYDILQCSLNTLPLVSQVLPFIQVYYDDDSYIPLLSETEEEEEPSQNVINNNINIDDFVKQNMEGKNIDSRKNKDDKNDDTVNVRFSWLLCCSSVFMIDKKEGKIFSSYNSSLLPLLSHMINLSDSSSVIRTTFHIETEENLFDDRHLKMDLGTAHGHVCLL